MSLCLYKILQRNGYLCVEYKIVVKFYASINVHTKFQENLV